MTNCRSATHRINNDEITQECKRDTSRTNPQSLMCVDVYALQGCSRRPTLPSQNFRKKRWVVTRFLRRCTRISSPSPSWPGAHTYDHNEKQSSSPWETHSSSACNSYASSFLNSPLVARSTQRNSSAISTGGILTRHSNLLAFRV